MNNSVKGEEELDCIFAYSRADAIKDGVLVDVSEMAREAGFRFPVALTHAAFETCVSVPANVPCQDEEGRLWDVLNVARFSILQSEHAREVVFTPRVKNDAGRAKRRQLKAVVGAGDSGEPVVTIMLPTED